MTPLLILPLIPAEAGTQCEPPSRPLAAVASPILSVGARRELGPRFRGDEREERG